MSAFFNMVGREIRRLRVRIILLPLASARDRFYTTAPVGHPLTRLFSYPHQLGYSIVLEAR